MAAAAENAPFVHILITNFTTNDVSVYNKVFAKDLATKEWLPQF